MSNLVAFSAYHTAFDTHLANTPRAPFVTRYTDPEHTYLSTDRSGIVIVNHGNGKIEGAGLFSAGPKGSGLALLDFTIQHYGVNYVECFAPLHEIYARLDFVSMSVSPFNWDYAPEGWHPSLGTPDYHEMSLLPMF